MVSRGRDDVERDTFKLEANKHAHERWWQEDELVNQRTTWLLTTQGVLGTAYGFLLYRIAEVRYTLELQEKLEAGRFVDELERLAGIVAIIGIGSSGMSFMGILAACIAQHCLSRLHGNILGVNKWTTVAGQAVAVFTPLLCIGAWTWLWWHFPGSYPECLPIWPRPVLGI
jgi:hypothetical protein